MRDILRKIPKRGFKRERILRVIANNPSGKLSIRHISIEAETSRSWVKKFLKQLENREIIRGTKIINFQLYFGYWQQLSFRPLSRSYTIKDVLKAVDNTNLQYAFTTYMGENNVQGHLFRSRFDAYINPEEQEKWHNYLSNIGLVGRGNFRILISDSHVFYQSKQVKGYTTVSIPQLIVDLLNEGGVCIEAAHMLTERYEKNAL